jgi:hypothetical protein
MDIKEFNEREGIETIAGRVIKFSWKFQDSGKPDSISIKYNGVADNRSEIINGTCDFATKSLNLVANGFSVDDQVAIITGIKTAVNEIVALFNPAE